jgi:hypothetical protein
MRNNLILDVVGGERSASRFRHFTPPPKYPLRRKRSKSSPALLTMTVKKGLLALAAKQIPIVDLR